MYARLVRFALADGKHDVATKLSSDLVPAITSQPGCKGATCFGDGATGEYGLFVLWESTDAASAAAAIIAPRLEQHLAGNTKRAADHHLYEVIAHS